MGDALRRGGTLGLGPRWCRRAVLWLCAAVSGMVALAQATPASTPAPQRIVSLLPSATEAVCAMGACGRLVGVDVFSQDPPAVRHLPQLGRTWQPDIERIVQLQPDLVLVGRGPAQQRLQAAGLRVLEVDAATVAQVQQSLQRIDAALQLQRADALWQQVQARVQQIAQASQQARQSQPVPRVYLEVDAAMYAAGPHSYMGELLAQLGAQNIAPADGAHFPRLSPEYVVRADPDVIIQTHAASLRDLAQRPGWSTLRAVRHGAVCQLTPSQSRVLTRPGPHLDAAVSVLAQCLGHAQRARHLLPQPPSRSPMQAAADTAVTHLPHAQP